MQKEKIEEARLFLEELANAPPWLPYEPSLLPQLFAATRSNSTASVDDLTALIERSQKLAARVLALANSAVYGLESTVTSLHRAVSVLGFREVRSLTIMIGAVSAIKGAKLPKSFDAQALWQHQLKTAAVAKSLAAVWRENFPEQEGDTALVMEPDEAYAAGLLHDIGKVFFAATRPALWEAVEEVRQISYLRYFEAENAYWGMDHALIGAQVLHYWKLPLLLTDPISWHHAPMQAPAYKAEACLLAAANNIAHAGLDAEGALFEEALAFLPEGADPAKLGEAVAQSLGRATPGAFVDLVK